MRRWFASDLRGAVLWLVVFAVSVGSLAMPAVSRPSLPEDFVDGPFPRFSYVLPNKPRILTTPLVVRDYVFVGASDGALYGFDRRSGALVWRYPAAAPVSSTPVYADGRLYVGTDDGYLHAIQVTDGVMAWRRYVGGKISDPVVDGNAVYFGTARGFVHAFALGAGNEIWRSGYLYGAVMGRPALVGGLVVVRAPLGSLNAYHATSGEVKWVSPNASGGFSTNPSVAGQVIFAATAFGRVHAIRVGDGANLWTFDTPNAGSASSGFGYGTAATVVGDAICIANRDRYLFSVDRRAGTAKWMAELSGWVDRPGVAADGAVFLASTVDDGLNPGQDARVTKVRVANGHIEWEFTAAFGRVIGGLTAADGVLYFGDANGVFYAIDVESGRI